MEVLYFLWRSIPMLLQMYADLYLKIDFLNTMIELETELNVPMTKTYDFIIVGGGSAGSVVAGRLSEKFEVLLLEAGKCCLYNLRFARDRVIMKYNELHLPGGSPPPGTIVPFFMEPVQSDPTINYLYKTVPQTNAALCCNGTLTCFTGKMLGGTGSHNTMFHSRGSPKDFDNWANILNDDSFSYTNVLKYFKKMENFVGEKFGPEGDATIPLEYISIKMDYIDNYGYDGPIVVDNHRNAIIDTWFEIGRELGYQIFDPNGFQQEGFTTINEAVHDGQRSSSYAEYVKPYENSRRNLTVIRYANVSEILLDNNKRAYGVAYTRHGFPLIANARKEIILSAGSYSSPLLLLKSGIGPESILNAAEIPVKVPLEAVGKNLIEHPSTLISTFPVSDSSILPKVDLSDIANIAEEYHKGEGLLKTPGIYIRQNEQGGLTIRLTAAQCFIVSTKAEAGWPDIWITIETFVNTEGNEQGVNLRSILGRPRSKGLLTLDTEKYKAGIRDDVQLALIDYKFLTDPDDVDVILDGINLILRIVESNVFKNFNISHGVQPDPACSDFTFLSADYWKCKICQSTSTSNHPVGTCSMGADSETSVVDTKFRVHGVSSLRVVDASVIPVITNSNVNAPIMMLAEKAAEDIINFYLAPEAPTNDARDDTTPNTASTMLINILLLLIIFAFIVKSIFS